MGESTPVQEKEFHVMLGMDTKIVWTYAHVSVKSIPLKDPYILKGNSVVNCVTEEQRPATPDDYSAALKVLMTSDIPMNLDSVDGMAIARDTPCQNNCVVWLAYGKKKWAPANILCIKELPLDTSHVVYYSQKEGTFYLKNCDTGYYKPVLGKHFFVSLCAMLSLHLHITANEISPQLIRYLQYQEEEIKINWIPIEGDEKERLFELIKQTGKGKLEEIEDKKEDDKKEQ